MAIGAIILGALMGPTISSGQDPDLRETVTVSSTSSVDVPPDLARISVGVNVDAATAQEAAQRLSADTNRVVDAYKAAGFTEDELSIRDVNVFQRRKDRQVIGYTATTAVVVKTTELDRVGEIIDIGVDAGANTVRGVDFELDDDSAAIKQALRQAMEFAKEKADVLATTSGRTLGRALVIEEGGTRAPGSVDFVRGVAASASSGSSGGAPSFPVIPPDLTVRTRIVVTFALQ
ncbi:MAG: uncharacterized protein QOG54_2094 [Actinomycetota bacterium]|jgi:uncharacterized protein YggE|nr:uncharacterized protein [Actinomycetota bacterium]